MKRKGMQTIISMIALATIVAAAAGCGSSSGDSASQVSQGNSEGQQSDEGELDTISSTQSKSGSDTEKKDTWLSDHLVTITYARPESSLQPYNPDCLTVKWIRENLGIDLQVSTYSDYDTKMNTLLAANQLPDLFTIWGNASDIISTDSLLVLNDYIDKYCPNIQNDYANDETLRRYEVNNNIYTLAQMRRDENWEQGSVPCIRTDLLKEQGLETPTTWDELYDVLGKLAEAYPDKIAYGARGDDRVLFNYMSPIGGLGGTYGMYQDDEGTWHMGCLEDSYKEALQYIHNMYLDGILDSEYLITSADDWKSGLGTGKYMFYYDNPVFLDSLNKTLQETDPDAVLEPIPLLANANDDIINYGHPNNYYNVWGISADTEDPETLMKFVDWLYSDQGSYTMNYGIEGETYELVDGKPQFLESVVEEYKSRSGDPTYEAGSEIGIGDLFLDPGWYSNYDAQFKTSSTFSWTRENIHKVYIDQMQYVIQQPVEPPYTTEESERITEINQNYMDYSKTEINKFISGERSFDDWDNFVQELIDRGAQERVDIANQAEARFKEGNN